MGELFPISDRSRVKLFGARGVYDKSDVYAAIDSSLYGTIAYTIDGQPYATPTMVWRQGDHLYWHGSAGSRMLKTVVAGPSVCVTFVHVDGFVMSRLASAHAMNYRSVMVFGSPEPVEDLGERRAQLEFFLSRLFPGRWDEVKQPSHDELRGIIMVRMPMQEASLKRRAGAPADGRAVFGGEKLFEQTCWAGTLPLSLCVGQPEDADRLHDSVVQPDYLASFAARFGMDARVEGAGRWKEARVVSGALVADAIKLFRLCPTEGIFPAVAAGAHCRIGIVLPDGTRDMRPYTIVNADPAGAWYEIAVQRDAAGRGGSRYLHERIEIGALLRVEPPQNDFALAPDARHSVLIAGGIGITPILAMARELEATKQPFEVHYSARGRSEAAFADELASYRYCSFAFYDTSLGADARMPLERVIGPFEPGRHVYVCGPHGMIAATLAAGAALGYPEEAMHREAFGAPPPVSTDGPVEVTLQRSGKTLTVKPGDTILEAVLREGVEVKHSCKRGECGLCTTETVAGAPDHRDHFLTSTQRGEGKMCICVSWAHSPDLTLNL